MEHFGLSVRAKTQAEAEQRALVAVKRLGEQLGVPKTLDKLLVYLNERGIKHTHRKSLVVNPEVLKANGLPARLTSSVVRREEKVEAFANAH